jgi:mannose-6-phosphate isomerase-like protein (cupin superfamily)
VNGGPESKHHDNSISNGAQSSLGPSSACVVGSASPTRISHSRVRNVPAYITKDGSEIRELMHPDHHGNCRQSLAEATVQPGAATVMHRHEHSEELYHITSGQGILSISDQRIEVGVGDTVCIPPGTPHCILNTGTIPLKILCCCAPPYSHEDTALV